jgi:hypothetical protein
MISTRRQYIPNRAITASVALLVSLSMYLGASHAPTETVVESSKAIESVLTPTALPTEVVPAVDKSRPVREDAYLPVADGHHAIPEHSPSSKNTVETLASVEPVEVNEASPAPATVVAAETSQPARPEAYLPVADRHPAIAEQSPPAEIPAVSLAAAKPPRVEQLVDSAGMQTAESPEPAAKIAAKDSPVEPANKDSANETSPARPAITRPRLIAQMELRQTIETESRPVTEIPQAVRVAEAQAVEPDPADSPASTMTTNVPATAAAPQTRYQRLDRDGEPVTADEPWSCVRDNRSKLVWEVKTDDGGLHDARYQYSWFDPSLDRNAGVRNGGRCGGGVDCDTHAYQAALNRQRFCGLDDWRLPSKQELQTLVVLGNQGGKATIDRKYFPGTAASWYWTASANETRPDYAWYVLFRNGIPLNDLKERPKHLRLVSGTRLLMASSD